MFARHLILAFILTLVCGFLSAQPEGLKPGLYAVVNGEYVPMKITYGGASSLDIQYTTGLQGFIAVVRYKGTSSGFEAADSFVYVLDPEKKVQYSPFNRGMNPNKMRVLPLTVNKEEMRREYSALKRKRIKFEWEKLGDGIFEIHLPKLDPGEYGIVFRKEKFGPFDYTRLYCFSVF